MLAGPSQNNRSKKRYRSQTSPANAEPTVEQLVQWAGKNANSQEPQQQQQQQQQQQTDNAVDLLDLFSTPTSEVALKPSTNTKAGETQKKTTSSSNDANTDDVFGLFGFDDKAKTTSTTKSSGSNLQANTSTSNTTATSHNKGRTFDDFDMEFTSPKGKNDQDTKRPTNNIKTNKEEQPKKNKEKEDENESEKEYDDEDHEEDVEDKEPEKKENDKQDGDKKKKPSYPPPDPSSPKSPPKNKAPSPPGPSEDASQTSDTKSIDVLPLMHKGIRMNKFKMNGSSANVRLFFLSVDNQYFCWSPNLDNKNTFDVANLIKSNEDRRIMLESIKDVKRNPESVMQNIRFIPTDRKSCTLTITYNANHKPKIDAQKGRARSFTQGASGLRPPSYKQICIMAYEPFHFEMVVVALGKLVAISRDPNEHLENLFELYVDFPKSVLPKHLRPQKYKWEALQQENATSDKAPRGDDESNLGKLRQDDDQTLEDKDGLF